MKRNTADQFCKFVKRKLQFKVSHLDGMGLNIKFNNIAERW